MADFDPDAYLASKVKTNPFDAALLSEGVSGRKADFIKSIYQQESGSGANTKTSNAGATGGMQIIPTTFNGVADKGWNINNPEHNMRAGIRYASQAFDASGGDPALAGAYYYGGPGGMRKAAQGVAVSDPRNPNAPTTLQYGQQVAARMPSTSSPQAVRPAFDPDAYLSAIPQKSVQQPQQSMMDSIKQGAGNLAAGAVRGAGSIGSTILAAGELLPSRMISRVAAGGNILPDMKADSERRQGMDAGLQELGAQPDSWMYKGGKLGGEILGTAGTGNALALGAKGLGASPTVVNALSSGGMNVAGATGRNALAARVFGGAATGAASTALISPDVHDIGLGAAIGSGLPVIAKGASLVGNAMGRTAGKGAQTPEMVNAIMSARDAGYVIPPTQANPTFANKLIEGFSGKLTTAQNASARNSEVTSGLAAKAIGLPAETTITPDILASVRKSAGESYEALASLPIKPAQQASTISNTPAIAEINPKDMVFDLRKSRNEADAWYKSYARTADPDSLVKAKAFKSEATEIEKGLEDYAASLGKSDLVKNMIDARTLIAKTHTVESALNPSTGTIDARKLGSALKKGKPLTDELRQAGEFANRFPKASQTVEGMGSLPQTSPLDWGAAGAISAASGNVLPMLSAGARPIARKLALSNMVQNRLIQQSPRSNRLAELLQYSPRAIPAIASQ